MKIVRKLCIFCATAFTLTATALIATSRPTPPSLIDLIPTENITRLSTAETPAPPNIEITDNKITYSDPSLKSEPTKPLKGTLEIIAAELPLDSESPDQRYFIVSEAGAATPINLNSLPTALETGAVFTGEVTEHAEVAAAEIVLPATTTNAAKHRLYIGIVATTDAVRTASAAEAQTLATTAKTFWLREGNGQIESLEIFTKEYSLPAACNLPERLTAGANATSQADETAKAFGFSSYAASQTDQNYKNHIITYLPSACYGKTYSGTYGGLAVVGTGLTSGGWITFVDADRYLNIPFISLNKNNDWILTHELGHNFGLSHGGALNGTTYTSAGEYRNGYNVMGTELSPVPALPAIYRDKLAVATSELETLVPSATPLTRTLLPLSTPDKTSALKITNSGKVYYIEYRNGRDLDAGAYYANSINRNGYCFGSGINISIGGTNNAASLITKQDTIKNCWRTYFTSGEELQIDNFAIKIDTISGSSATVTITQLLPIVTNPIFTPTPKPFWLRLLKPVRKLNVSTGAEADSLSEGSVLLFTTEIIYNGESCLRTRDDSDQNLPLCIPYSKI
jgi:hypothetical protein